MEQSGRGFRGERRELQLGPEHFDIGEKGEVVVRSQELDRALEDADIGPGRGELTRDDVSVGVVVSRSF
jgi:hypothetical protein